MQHLLELLHEYRGLCANEASLEASTRPQMHALRHLLGDGLPWEGEPTRGMHRAVAYPLRFTVPGGFALGEVRRLGGGGVLVGTSAKPPIGARSLVCFEDPSHPQSFVFPATVAMRQPGRFGAVGLVFDGQPDRTPTNDHWRARLPLIRAHAPLVA